MIWQEWNNEYKTIINEGGKLYFFEYLSNKLHDKIKHIMVDKFIKLGFKYDSSVQKIVVPIPIPKQLNFDFSSNYTITDEMTALMQTESNEDTILMSRDKELKIPSENCRTLEVIDSVQQGLNPDYSSEEILEPMDIDKKKITMFNFL
ncbi:uncharacterized protein LOC126908481 isoform X2 [Daktulosphaira vitifoliae]|uniref:uncharacterized protein LOC126908481 isoform X2 n=1 Tax=Daktulosphaira vitifoliae TaxID=58002 RepID=UPI0021A9F161|nr:uncharacterized protein LOC126908481 isoform X2 [Daktulosphaira vitifoliae]